MPWVEVLAVFLVAHLIGDYVLQTNWQALNKHDGLGSDPEARRALLSHIATYTLAFVPGLVWLSDDVGWAALGVAAAIAVPHLIQDDGRLVMAYVRKIKHAEPMELPIVFAGVDQTLHVVALFVLALIVGT